MEKTYSDSCPLIYTYNLLDHDVPEDSINLVSLLMAESGATLLLTYDAMNLFLTCI